MRTGLPGGEAADPALERAAWYLQSAGGRQDAAPSQAQQYPPASTTVRLR
jgi:hypothetical protein